MRNLIEKIRAIWWLAGKILVAVEEEAGEQWAPGVSPYFWEWLAEATVAAKERSQDIQLTVTIPLPPQHPVRLASTRKRSDGQLQRRMKAAASDPQGR